VTTIERVFQDGSWVLVVDPRGRRLLLRLKAGASVNTHRGLLEHDSVIGIESGATVATRSGSSLAVWAPSFEDIVLEMPRGAQIIYPKDIAAMLGALSLEPGLRVLEAGFGSGAMTMGLLRQGASVVTVEKREDFAHRGQKNVESYLPASLHGQLEIVVGNVMEVELSGCFDRIVLDLLDPWLVVAHLRPLLASDGRVVVYVTNINQVQETVRAMRANHLSIDAVKEILERNWVVNGDVVRPEQKMIGHTGFIISARASAPRPVHDNAVTVVDNDEALADPEPQTD
jgi:tRNA (adenine57-N1/adenine58-N1)-methyltransferase